MAESLITLDFKISLFAECKRIIEEKIQFENMAINNAQNAANLETKSSAGDKYETGRAMMHIEKEKHGFQLELHQKSLQILSQIDYQSGYTEIKPGAICIINNMYYLFGVSIGNVMFQGFEFMTLSMGSPLGKILFHKKEGDFLEFRGKIYSVQKIV